MINWILRRSALKMSARSTNLAVSSPRPRTLRIAAALILAAVPLSLRSTEARAPRAGNQSSNTPAGNAQNGKLVFESQGCNRCHGSEGEGLSAPGQKGGIPRIAASPLALTAFIQQVRKPAGQMPPFSAQKVSEADLADVYAFLQSLKPSANPEIATVGNPKNGQRLFTNYGCYECHGNLGQGSTRTGGSRLGPPQIPLSGFASYVRQPTGDMPPYATKIVSSQDLADIYSFLQSIQQPPPLKTIPLLNQ